MSDVQRSNVTWTALLAGLLVAVLAYIMGATLLLSVTAGIGGIALVFVGGFAATEEYE